MSIRNHEDVSRAGPTAPSAGRPRIAALDVIRGFALCGILLANIQPIANAGPALAVAPARADAGHALLGLLVDHRFFPIFSVLFGIGFALLLESAAGRTARPRLVLLRRLLVLLAAGAAHFLLLWQGDILSTYALVGILVLLPSSWLPRWAVAGLAVAFVGTSLVIGDGRFTLVAGLFLAGAALVRYRIVARMEHSRLALALLGAGFVAAAIPALWLQIARPDLAVSSILAGLLMAGGYVCLLLLLLSTPLRSAVHAVFAPLGRMALTNYLTATVLVLIASRILGGQPENWSSGLVFAIAAVVIGTQWLWSTLWLRRFRYGPLEWLWRWATWARRP